MRGGGDYSEGQAEKIWRETEKDIMLHTRARINVCSQITRERERHYITHVRFDDERARTVFERFQCTPVTRATVTVAMNGARNSETERERDSTLLASLSPALKNRGTLR